MDEEISYVLDSNNIIVRLSDSWHKFACENDAPELEPANVIGTSIWSYLSGLETKKLFHQLFNKLRATHQTIVIPFRCDSPVCQRYMTMRLSLESQNGIKLDCVLDKRVPTKPVPLYLRGQAKTGTPLNACSMCKRIELTTLGWLDVVDAIIHEPRLQTNVYPPFTESICPDCLDICLGYSYVYSEAKSPERALSLLVFLHGAAQVNTLFRLEAPPRLADNVQNAYPMLIVSPLKRQSGHWELQDVMQIIEEIKQAFPIDTNRIYLTGISLGGIAALRLGMQYKKQFAALVPIATAMPPNISIEPLTQTPIWFFHGGHDRVFSCRQVESLVAAIKQEGGEAKLTVYPNTGHDAWSQAYHEEGLWRWLEEQKLN